MSDLRALIADLEGGALPAFALEQRIHEAITGRPCGGVAPPPYLCSVNTALRLVPAGLGISLTLGPGGWTAEVTDWAQTPPLVFQGASSQPEECVAIAALKARMAEETSQ